MLHSLTSLEKHSLLLGPLNARLVIPALSKRLISKYHRSVCGPFLNLTFFKKKKNDKGIVLEN